MKPTDAELEAAAAKAVNRALYWYTTGLELGEDYLARRMLAAVYESGIYLSADGGECLERMVDAIRHAVKASLRTHDEQSIITAYLAAGFGFSPSARYLVTKRQ